LPLEDRPSLSRDEGNVDLGYGDRNPLRTGVKEGKTTTRKKAEGSLESRAEFGDPSGTERGGRPREKEKMGRQMKRYDQRGDHVGFRKC